MNDRGVCKGEETKIMDESGPREKKIASHPNILRNQPSTRSHKPPRHVGWRGWFVRRILPVPTWISIPEVEVAKAPSSSSRGEGPEVDWDLNRGTFCRVMEEGKRASSFCNSGFVRDAGKVHVRNCGSDSEGIVMSILPLGFLFGTCLGIKESVCWSSTGVSGSAESTSVASSIVADTCSMELYERLGSMNGSDEARD